MHTVDWLLVLSFPVCWGIGAWLFWKWDLGGYRSEHESRPTKRGADFAPGTIISLEPLGSHASDPFAAQDEPQNH